MLRHVSLTIYGAPQSRTMRTLWMAAELGLEYTHVPLAFDDPALKSAEFLNLNPAGTIPTIVDDGVVVAESLAINLYLAKKYGRGEPLLLYPETTEDEAAVWRWTLWAQGHLEPWVQQDRSLADLRAAIGPGAHRVIATSLGLLDRTLAKQRWLVGQRFSVADMNVAAVLSPSRARHLDLESLVHIRTWLSSCYNRPAAIATRRRFAS